MSLIPTPATPSVFDGKENIYTQAEQASNSNEKELLYLKNDTPLELPVTVESAVMTTTELAIYFNETLRPIAKDYYGSEVFPDATGHMNVNLTFKAINEGDETNRIFMPVSGASAKRSENDVLNKLNTINAMNMGSNTMALTNYGAEIIYDLISRSVRRGMNPNKPESMKKLIGEMKENTGYGITVQNVYSKVVGIDIGRLLSLTFGTTNKKGDKVIYRVNPIRPVVAGAMADTRANYIIEIQSMSLKSYDAAMAKAGMMPMAGAITAITGGLSSIK